MKKLPELIHIEDVKTNNRVNIEIILNNDYTILIEGSFQIELKTGLIIHSEDYIESNFDSDIFYKIRTALKGQKIMNSFLEETDGQLEIELENSKIRSFYSKGDFETWELSKLGKTIYSSESGNIIFY